MENIHTIHIHTEGLVLRTPQIRDAQNRPFRALMASLGAGTGREVDGRNWNGKVVVEALYEIEKKDRMGRMRLP